MSNIIYFVQKIFSFVVKVYTYLHKLYSLENLAYFVMLPEGGYQTLTRLNEIFLQEASVLDQGHLLTCKPKNKNGNNNLLFFYIV